jgi:uncharacterized protein Usg
MADRQFIDQLSGYSLTTAEILYRLPDHPNVLQTFLWQDYDLHPKYPKLKGFLDFWSANIDGALHTIRIAHARLIRPCEVQFLKGDFRLH